MKSSSKSSSSSNGRSGHRSSADGSDSHDEIPRSHLAKAPKGADDRDQADLDKVRDLLFGRQSQQHSQDIEAQSERLAALEANFTERLSALDTQFSKQLRNAEQELRSELQAEVAAIVARLDEQGTRKVERSDLRSMLSDLATRIGD